MAKTTIGESARIALGYILSVVSAYRFAGGLAPRAGGPRVWSGMRSSGQSPMPGAASGSEWAAFARGGERQHPAGNRSHPSHGFEVAGVPAFVIAACG